MSDSEYAHVDNHYGADFVASEDIDSYDGFGFLFKVY
jgi:hypothetical protein